MATYDWPAAKDRTLLGKAVSRLDGPAKVTGIAKYAFDVSLPGMLHAKLLTCPHAHADIVSIDTERARALPGVKVVKVLEGPGKTIRWAHAEIAIAVAEREEQAMDAVRAIDVEYVVKPAFVGERNLDAAPETRDGEERLEGDPYASMAEAA
ncbi:MAG: xanthine dehydrogenase family protein molybdopterin-binding subunit, partial [Planctomycetota bacterium]|nr:xanthine dehydrogenase family protein molybdopterin-binding subunit [Planctomycetota bacterium]